MAKAKLKFRLHRTVIVLICLALLVVLMQGASWFSLGHQMARSEQVEELAHTLTRQVAWSLTPLMENSDDNHQKITDTLDQLTHDSRILDASVYDDEGSLIAHSGESINVRDRLALDGQRAGSYFNHQIVQPLANKEGPHGFLRVTLDTHVLVTESKQVDNTTNILRLMMLLALAIGIILTRTLLRDRRTRWQQSPFLLTASNPVKEDDEEAEEENSQGSGLNIRITDDSASENALQATTSTDQGNSRSSTHPESIGALINSNNRESDDDQTAATGGTECDKTADTISPETNSGKDSSKQRDAGSNRFDGISSASAAGPGKNDSDR